MEPVLSTAFYVSWEPWVAMVTLRTFFENLTDSTTHWATYALRAGNWENPRFGAPGDRKKIMNSLRLIKTHEELNDQFRSFFISFRFVLMVRND